MWLLLFWGLSVQFHEPIFKIGLLPTCLVSWGFFVCFVLQILDPNHLLHVQSAKIFFCSVSCLFTQLTVFFALSKLLLLWNPICQLLVIFLQRMKFFPFRKSLPMPVSWHACYSFLHQFQCVRSYTEILDSFGVNVCAGLETMKGLVHSSVCWYPGFTESFVEDAFLSPMCIFSAFIKSQAAIVA